jgi:hypothetical protein
MGPETKVLHWLNTTIISPIITYATTM